MRQLLLIAAGLVAFNAMAYNYDNDYDVNTRQYKQDCKKDREEFDSRLFCMYKSRLSTEDAVIEMDDGRLMICKRDFLHETLKWERYRR